MCRLFGRPMAHTGDITRARVELVWLKLRQALWAMQRQARQVVVMRRGGRHERRHSSDKQLQRR